MKESDLLQYCHYYKGERENPYEGKEPGKSIYWFYEQCWVKFMLDDNDKYIANISQEYEAYGLTDFEKIDGTPESLKALLFNRYAHWQSANISGFKRWYIENYRNDIM